MDVIKAIAERGVKVYILIYQECSLALTLNSKHSKDAMKNLSSNIKITRHPKEALDLLWSHHEKLVVIDQQISYVGGLDLCWGRFDTNAHPLIEPENSTSTYMFPGIDYSNARIGDFFAVNRYTTESADRKENCRMPWHDVHIRLEGPAAVDISRHFVERWNFSRFEDRENTITGIKSSAPQQKSDGSVGGWLGSLIASANAPKNEEKGIELTSAKADNLIPIKEEEGDGTKINLAKGFGNMIKKSEIKESQPEENSNTINTSAHNFGANLMQKKTVNDIMEEYYKDKEKIDDDHLLRMKEKPQVEQETVAEHHLSDDVANAYSKLVKRVSKVKAKKHWFGEEKKLSAKVKMGLFKKGTRSKVQVLRSASKWSAGISKTENSILQGYYNLIDNAKHYIYIENQFFVSKSFTEEERKNAKGETSRIVENEIAYHIRKRIELAYNNKEKFHVFVFIPLLPGFAGEPEESSTVQVIFKYTIGTISHNQGLSICEKLQEIMPKEEISNYISFFSLRGHALVKDVPTTELIYIHSKLMIVDDQKIIIGSANINDRSMLGTRDSEFAVIVQESYTFKSKMNGDDYNCAKFAATFRRALMAEHLGMDPKDSILEDPLNDEFNTLLKDRAKNNTLIYRDLFGCYPDDTYTNFKKLKERKRFTKPAEIEQLKIDYGNKHKDIKGHIVEFPLDFLHEESLGINFFSKENLVPERNFT